MGGGGYGEIGGMGVWVYGCMGEIRYRGEVGVSFFLYLSQIFPSYLIISKSRAPNKVKSRLSYDSAKRTGSISRKVSRENPQREAIRTTNFKLPHSPNPY